MNGFDSHGLPGALHVGNFAMDRSMFATLLAYAHANPLPGGLSDV
ncbi:hypothetical protein BH09PSE5_BH09PSE5_12130 [soil metagenome]